MKLSAKSKSPTHRVIVYGPPKSGKTELVGGLATKYNLIWLDLENGHSTLFKRPQEEQERIELICIPDTKTYPIAIETLLKIFSVQEVSICAEHGKVSCPKCKESGEFTSLSLKSLEGDTDTILVIDSLTQLSNSAMNYLTRNQDELYKPEWSDYRNQGQLLDKILSQIQQARFNIVCITHETETEMEDGKKRLVPVCGTTTFSRNTAKYFDHVVYCEVKNKSHVAASSTAYSNIVLTGSRTNATVESEKIPSLHSIFSAPTPVAKAGNVGAVTSLLKSKLS